MARLGGRLERLTGGGQSTQEGLVRYVPIRPDAADAAARCEATAYPQVVTPPLSTVASGLIAN